jgi:hypothetical protein
MSNSLNEAKVTYSGFRGLQENYALCDRTHALNGFNVEFENGIIKRRKGRQKLLDTFFVRPIKILSGDPTSGFLPENTRLLTDGDTTTTVLTNPFLLTGNFVYLGFPFRVVGFKIFVTVAAVQNVTLDVRLFNYTTTTLGQWSTVASGIVDGTAVGGFTLKQTGIVQFAFGDWAATGNGWAMGGADGSVIFDQDLFWIRIGTNTTTTSANISEIQGYILDKNSVNLRGETGNITEFVTRTGDRLPVATNDYPGHFNDTTFAEIGESRAFYFDLSRGDIVPIRIPGFIKKSAGGGQKTSAIIFNGWCIGTTSSGYLWKFDGTNASALEAMPGLDAVNNVLGAQSYLAQTPRGTILETYRNRLAVTGDVSAPLSFYLSIEDNNISLIPAQATVGGPNIWPVRYIFNVPGREGDYIVSASVINDRYVILTRTQTWVFDDVSLKAINIDLGCVAAGSMQRIDNSIFYLSDQGVVICDSIQSKIISAPIWNTLRDIINWRVITACASAHDKSRGDYWLWLPINGEYQNQIAVIYNYITGYWRIIGGWYPFDTNARRDANSVVMSVTAATQLVGSSGKKALVSVDSTGVLWQENVGYDDAGSIFPAYVAMKPLGSKEEGGGEDYVATRTCYINVGMDAGWWEVYALSDGERFDQELDRRFANVATNSFVVQKQALIQNSVAASVTEQTYGATPAWPVSPNFSQPKKLKMSFGDMVTKVQPVIHWSMGQYSAGSYINKVAGSMPLADFEFVTVPKAGGR